MVRHPTVVVLSTGDELVDAPEALSPGKIMDSNGLMLAGLCAGFLRPARLLRSASVLKPGNVTRRS